MNLNFFQLSLCLYKFNRNSKFKRILNANTHNIRITNADGQGTSLAFISFANLFKIRNIKTLSLLKRDENFFCEKSSEGVLIPIVEQKSCDEKRIPPSSKNFVFRMTSQARHSFDNIETMLRSL